MAACGDGCGCADRGPAPELAQPRSPGDGAPPRRCPHWRPRLGSQRCSPPGGGGGVRTVEPAGVASIPSAHQGPPDGNSRGAQRGSTNPRHRRRGAPSGDGGGLSAAQVEAMGLARAGVAGSSSRTICRRYCQRATRPYTTAPQASSSWSSGVGEPPARCAALNEGRASSGGPAPIPASGGPRSRRQARSRRATSARGTSGSPRTS